jgi:F-type H+-transporting ATPase subunit epsilon
MKLRIVTPLSILVDEEIDALRAEDASGSFGVLPGHAPFLTALAISIVSWRTDETERFCAVRGGVMTVAGTAAAVTRIDIATREAIAGDDLATLDAEVLAHFQSEAEAERAEHIEAMRLQFNAVRRMVRRLQPGKTASHFR